MNKNNMLLIIITILLLIPINNVYAYNLNRISNINNAPRIKGKRTIYITNMNNSEVKINNTSSFKKEGTSIRITEKLKKSKEYTKPYSITFKNAGYYINDNGDAVYVNVIVNIDSLYIYLPKDYSKTVSYYHITGVYSSGFWQEMYAYDKNNNSLSLGDYHVGQHSKITFTIVKSDGSALDSNIASNMMIPWYLWESDVADHTTGVSSYDTKKTYVESIKFNSGFDNNIYVYDKTILKISSNNSKYSGTSGTGSDGQPSSDYSTVVAYQTSPSATVEWWGSRCGTSFQIRASSFDYPYMKQSSKNANASIYKPGDKISYTINQKFPYTIDSNKAKSITLSDTFDNALDIRNITFNVSKGRNDDTNNWRMEKNGQTVKLTYKNTNFTSVLGDYTFTFSNIIIKTPDSNHSSVRMSQVDK